MKKFIICALLAGTATAAAQEPDDTVQLRELVVSATRLPTERSTLAASVTVLSVDELRLKGVRNVADALRTESGAALVQTGSYGAFASLFLRGGESDYVQVLIDGVQVNSPGEHFDFANLTLENIERIEIVRGPVSVLYGSDAVTGVVQLFTRPGSDRTKLSFAATGGLGERVGRTADGSFGSGSLNAELQGGSRGFSYGAGVSHFSTEGAYAFNNDYSNTGFTGRVAFAASAATDVGATVRYNTNTFHYPTDGAGNLVDRNQQHTADAIVAGIEVGHRLSRRLEARAHLGLNRNEDSYDDAPDDAADTLGFYAFYSSERFQRQAADVRINYSLAGASVLTLGSEFESQKLRGSNLSESEYGPFAGTMREQRGNRAAYAQVFGALKRLNFQAGARLEDNERFGNFATYRGGLSLPVSSSLRIRTAAGTGFKAPRFYEQFATGFVKGNPLLEPERSRSLEAGAELTRSGTRVGITLFAQRFRDLIQYVGMPAEADGSNYLNLGAVQSNGVELEAQHTRGMLSVRGSLTLLDTEVTDAGTGDDPLYFEGQRLIRRPTTTGALAAVYRLRSWTVSATANYVGVRDDLDFNSYPATRIELDPYTRIDATAERQLGRSGMRATLKVENLLESDYEEARNFPARGRMLFVGVRYTN